MKERDMKIYYDFDKVINRQQSDSIKWNLYPKDVLPMWVADMDFVSPKPVIQALQERIAHGIFGYPMGLLEPKEGIPELCELITDRMFDRYQWKIEPDDIILLPGVVPGFNLACQTIAKPNEAVLFQTPVYPPIYNVAETTGIQKQEMELTRQQDGSYIVDWDLFENKITPLTKLFILCNPHNPVGRVFKKDELTKFAEICLKHNITIVSDEIHSDLIFSNHKHIPIASLDQEIANNTITLIAPSKTYNIAGLQFSIAIIQNQSLRKRYIKSKDILLHWVNTLGIVAAFAAYAEGQDWLEQVLSYLEENRNFLYQYISNKMPEIKMGLPEGTYLAWLNCQEAGIQGNPYEFFLEIGRVAFNDGGSFGTGGEGYVRLNFGCPRIYLIDALNRMQTALQSIH